MAGLVPAIHAFLEGAEVKTWMPGTSPGMTGKRSVLEMELLRRVRHPEVLG
jgi:hypothetical protein